MGRDTFNSLFIYVMDKKQRKRIYAVLYAEQQNTFLFVKIKNQAWYRIDLVHRLVK